MLCKSIRHLGRPPLTVRCGLNFIYFRERDRENNPPLELAFLSLQLSYLLLRLVLSPMMK
uniref:Uncharacterized protein n=1 Tax=Utricularia reniformis TaxID=192314 RepID=A0A1Y0B0M7_9LAMI|nr:hypothetical protein AEK19_MT0704 [Utricularia reniformis]ART30950.1 hypothetical protein AEK19_MT0704 [Utricularia reniformis]